MARRSLLSLLLTFVVFTGCMPTAQVLREGVDCPSTVEGLLVSEVQWNRKVPALVVRDGRDEKVVYGEIVEQTDSTVVFDPGREGPFYDPEAKSYPLAEVVALVNEQREVVVGTVPDPYATVWFVELQVTPRQGGATQRLLLRPNMPFAYCLDPGTYIVEQVRFGDNQGNTDESVKLPVMAFNVQPETSTYIGSFELDVPPSDAEDVVAIPYRVAERKNPSIVAGIAGGAVGVGLLYLFRQARGAEGIRTLQVQDDSTFETQGSTRQRTHILQWAWPDDAEESAP
ncbi:MAG: hypothetical protein AAGG50_14080 [Bacteroidota bacterium]